jgi:hypothetical protein
MGETGFKFLYMVRVLVLVDQLIVVGAVLVYTDLVVPQ